MKLSIEQQFAIFIGLVALVNVVVLAWCLTSGTTEHKPAKPVIAHPFIQQMNQELSAFEHKFELFRRP